MPNIDGGGYWLTRLVFQRALGLVYPIAFIVALNQFRPLAGERGLLPAPAYLKHVAFRDAPSLFHFFPKDSAFAAAAWIGIGLVPTYGRRPVFKSRNTRQSGEWK